MTRLGSTDPQAPTARLQALRRRLADARALGAGQSSGSPDARTAAAEARSVVQDAESLLVEAQSWITQARAISAEAERLVLAHESGRAA